MVAADRAFPAAVAALMSLGVSFMADELSKQHARSVLEAAGFSVQDIPAVEKKSENRADLCIRRDREVYILEAKGKDATAAYKKLLEDVREDDYASVSREAKGWNALSSVIETADLQLGATPSTQDAVRLLWISCLHGDADFVFRAFKHRLYGMATVFIFTSPGPCFDGDRECLYYDHNDFYRRRNIDGVVLAGPKGCQLLINDFGTRAELLRRSFLYSLLCQSAAVFDPKRLEEEQRCIAIRADLDRHDDCNRWKYIKDTYGLTVARAKPFDFRGLVVATPSRIDGNDKR